MRGYRLLKASEIECRIQEIDRSGRFLRLLLYKTVRTDAAILDETHGPMNWQNDYKSIDGKLYCGIAVRSGTEWIWKWNTGTESAMEAQKGEASDAMKRAGFCWGIGTELYSAPKIMIWSPKAKIEKNSRDKLVCYDRFYVRQIEYDENQDICRLVIVNETSGLDVFAWSATRKQEPPTGAGNNPSAGRAGTSLCTREAKEDATSEFTQGEGSGEGGPEEEQKYFCKDCGAEITGYKIGDVAFSVKDHLRACRKSFGVPVCQACANKRLKGKAG